MKRILAFFMPCLPLSFFHITGFIIDQIIFDFLESQQQDQPYDQEDEDDEFTLRVAIVDDKAYWVVNNVFYQADVIDGEIMKDDAEPINAFNMSFKDVNKMMHILDNIQDWKN